MCDLILVRGGLTEACNIMNTFVVEETCKMDNYYNTAMILEHSKPETNALLVVPYHILCCQKSFPVALLECAADQLRDKDQVLRERIGYLLMICLVAPKYLQLIKCLINLIIRVQKFKSWSTKSLIKKMLLYINLKITLRLILLFVVKIID